MSRRTREINRITTAIITISIKLMVLALLVLLLYEAVVRGFAFGHEIFYAEAAEAAPGRKDKETVEKVAGELKKKGLIKNEFAFQFQSRFYDYGNIYPGTYELNTSMTSKEILQELNTEPEDREGNEETSVQTGKAVLPQPAQKAARIRRPGPITSLSALAPGKRNLLLLRRRGTRQTLRQRHIRRMRSTAAGSRMQRNRHDRK